MKHVVFAKAMRDKVTIMDAQVLHRLGYSLQCNDGEPISYERIIMNINKSALKLAGQIGHQ